MYTYNKKHALVCCGFIACLLLLSSQIALANEPATETPKYTVTETDGNIELRSYAPIIVAETLVSARNKDAGSQGFRILADYIFGNNTVTAGAENNSEKIAMTAPVIRSRTKGAVGNEAAATSEKIAMTAPVMRNKVTDSQNNTEQWRIQFVMPSNYSMATLPKPNNSQVTIKQLPEQRYAVIRFSGRSPETKMAKKTNELLQWMQKRSLTPSGEPQQARYNPPWTPAFMRRNEVMIAY